jgi:hypothetical protein
MSPCRIRRHAILGGCTKSCKAFHLHDYGRQSAKFAASTRSAWNVAALMPTKFAHCRGVSFALPCQSQRQASVRKTSGRNFRQCSHTSWPIEASKREIVR